MLLLLIKPSYLGFRLPSWQELHLEHRVVFMTNHDKIKTPRHCLPLLLSKAEQSWKQVKPNETG